MITFGTIINQMNIFAGSQLSDLYLGQSQAEAIFNMK